MDKILRPNDLDLDITTPDADKIYNFWEVKLKNLIEANFSDKSEKQKLFVLTQYLTYKTYTLVEDAKTYTEALETLRGTFVKTQNEVFARHLLITRKQKQEEGVDEYMAQLKMLAKNCNYTAVTAQEHFEESVRDAFVAGLKSDAIRERLLEEKITLTKAHEKARSVETAQKNNLSFKPSYSAAVAPHESPPKSNETPTPRYEYEHNSENQYSAAATSSCWNCGRRRHPLKECPARDVICFKCNRQGHFAKLCRGGSRPQPQQRNNQSKTTNATVMRDEPTQPVLAATSNPHVLKKSITKIKVDGNDADGLIDSGSSHGYVSLEFQRKYQLKTYPMSSEVSMASSSHSTPIHHFVLVEVKLGKQIYPKVKLMVLPDCVADVILGLDFQQKHQKVTFIHKGNLPPLEICGSTASKSFATLKTKPPDLFANLRKDCHPIREKSRRYSQEDQAFIRDEVARLESEGIIEKSNSPWRAQVLVHQDKSKKRLCIDYSSTINRFTLLDAYPLPNMNEMINKIALNDIHSTIDLKAAYHQIKIKDEDKPFTAFEANHRLYQFTRLPFGVTNGVAVFQRKMDEFVEDYKLEGVYPYMDNVTISGRNQEDHDIKLAAFMSAAKDANLTFNKDKCTFSTKKLYLLGTVIEGGEIKPDPERLKPLQEMPVPTDTKTLKRVQGFFSYYSTWIPNFSQKLKPLLVTEFPLSEEAIQAFNQLKSEIEHSVVAAVDESLPFQLETDASDTAIAATLNQENRPVAFFSRSLHGSELAAPAVEKEAQAIVESVRKWRHFLTRKHFDLVTDQKSIAYVFNTTHRNKIKNDKLARWKLELSCYQFDIKYKPGPENIPPDTLSRAYCSSVSEDKLRTLHRALSHPGVTRMYHFVRSKNLPYSTEEVKAVIRNCQVCSELKPQFYQPEEKTHLIKATKPYEKLNIDFKGPLPSTNQNKYFLHIVDEYSRFPFVYPCKDTSSDTVKQCLSHLFSLFGHPSYIHNDRGSSFICESTKKFLLERGIATSRTTPYRPEANGQVERFNGTVWRTIKLILNDRGMEINRWQEVLPEALHSVRSLLCTATNSTPHERFLSFPRRSSSGSSIPTWLMSPGPVLLKNFDRSSKHDSLVEEVELLETNPTYAHIKYPNGRESTVSIQHLAPLGTQSPLKDVCESQAPVNVEIPVDKTPTLVPNENNTTQISDSLKGDNNPASEIVVETSTPNLRRSGRERREPLRYEA